MPERGRPHETPLARIRFQSLDLAPIVQGRDACRRFPQYRGGRLYVRRLGYKRFWLAEHHNINGVASSATAVLISHVASQTHARCAWAPAASCCRTMHR